MKSASIHISARTRRILRQLAIIFGLLVTLSFAALGGLVAALKSEAGTAWLLQTTQKLLPELHIDVPRGNLIDGLHMDALRWETPDFALAIEQLELRLRWPDLLRWRVTIDPLHMQRLIINPRGPENDDPVVLPTLISPVALYLPDVAINELVIRSGDAVTRLRGIQTAARWLGPDLQLRGTRLSYEQLQLAAAGRLRFSGNYGVSLEGNLQGSPLPAAAVVKAGGDLRQFKLEAQLAGPWPLAAQAELRLLDKHLPMQLAAQLRQSVQLDLGADALTVKQAEFKAKGDLTHLIGTLNSRLADQRYGDSQLNSDLVWDGATLKTQSHLALPKGDVRSQCDLVTAAPAHWNCDGQIAALPLTPWLGGLTGEVSSPFTVSGKLADPIDLRIDIPALTGTLDKLTLTGAIKVDSPDLQRWNITTANLDAGQNHLKASGSLGANSQLAIRLEAPQLAQLYTGLAGTARVQIDITGPIKRPSLRGDWSLAKFRYGDIELAQGNGSLTVAALGEQTSDVRWQLRGLLINGFPLDTTATLSGTRERHQWQMALQSASPQNRDNRVDLRCQGLLATDFKTYQLDCPVLRGSIAVTDTKDVAWSQQTPLKARWDFARNEGELSGFCLHADPTSACLKPGLKYRQQRIEPFTAQVTALPLRWWRHQLPEGLFLRNDAHANAELNFVSQKPLRLDARATVESTEWRWRGSDNEPAQAVTLDPVTATAHFDAQTAHLATAIHSVGLGGASAELTVTDPIGAKRVQGRVAIEALQLSAFTWAIPDVDKLSGQIDGAVNFTGSAEQPLLQGQFALTNGAIDMAGLGDPVQNLSAGVRFDNQHAALNGQFQLGEGKAQLDGNIDWMEGYQKWKADLHLRGDKLAIEPITNSKIVFAPDLKLTATPGTLQVGGDVTLSSADIRLQQLPPETVNPSRDAVVSGRETDTTATAMTMDVNLNLGDHTHFAGFGADVDLVGQLRLRQEPAQELDATGRVNISKGRYRAYGQRLMVRKGQFIFIGNLDNPDLNLEAIRELPPGNQDVVGLRVTGSLRDPVAQLFSEQSLSESDIAYYLLTGRKRDTSQPGGQFSAGGTLLSLGLSRGEDQAAKLAEKFGIRGLQLGTTAGNNGSTEAEVSGYVFRDLYVRYGRSLGQTADSVTLQYQLSPNLMIQTITGIEEALDLIYTFTIQ